MAVSLSWPILGVIIPCILIAGLGYGVHFFVLVPTGASKWKLLGFQFALTMIWVSYYLAIRTPPGTPPPNFSPPPGTVRRWCFKCNGYKPERTHHCKTCKKCVTKMDHHCPWTYNCVGFNNMPHFVRFLLWVDVTTSYALFRLIKRCIEFYRLRNMPSYLIPSSEILMTILLTPVTFFVVFTVGLLTIRVLMNVTNGYTQIETWEEERLSSAKRRGLIPRNTRFPYDLGIYTNLVNTFGPIYTWPLPWGRPTILNRPESRNNAIFFERNESGYDDEGNPLAWPPDVLTVDPSAEYLEQLRLQTESPETTDENKEQEEGDYSSSDSEYITQTHHRRTGSDNHSNNAVPVTFAQTAHRQQQYQNRNSIEMSSIRDFAQPPPWLAQQYDSSDNSHNIIPSWRQTSDRPPRSNNDFYSRELWSTFEGEKLSDYGVDLDSEVDFSIYTMNRNNVTSRQPQSINHAQTNARPRHNLAHTGSQTASAQGPAPNQPPTEQPSRSDEQESTTASIGSSSSAALSRSSSPILRHSVSFNSPGSVKGAPAALNDVNRVSSLPSPIDSIDSRIDATDDALETKEGSSESAVASTSVTGPGPYNEEDLPLAKLLVMRRQEKIKLRTQ